jgi:hypothetical protein
MTHAFRTKAVPGLNCADRRRIRSARGRRAKDVGWVAGSSRTARRLLHRRLARGRGQQRVSSPPPPCSLPAVSTTRANGPGLRHQGRVSRGKRRTPRPHGNSQRKPESHCGQRQHRPPRARRISLSTWFKCCRTRRSCSTTSTTASYGCRSKTPSRDAYRRSWRVAWLTLWPGSTLGRRLSSAFAARRIARCRVTGRNPRRQ